jgi:hypothetical protein
MEGTSLICFEIVATLKREPPPEHFYTIFCVYLSLSIYIIGTYICMMFSLTLSTLLYVIAKLVPSWPRKYVFHISISPMPAVRVEICLPGRASSQLGRPAGGPERAERPEAAEVVIGGDEAARRLPRRQDLPERVQRLHPQLVCLHACMHVRYNDEGATRALAS